MYKWLASFIIFLFMISGGHAAAEDANLVKNPGFENNKNGTAVSWGKYDWKDRRGVTEFKLDNTQKHSGDFSLCIKSNFPNDARVKQNIKVKGDTFYKISCWVKTLNVGYGSKGANISIEGLVDTSKDVKGTSGGWQYIELYGKTSKNQKSMMITVGLGGYSNLNTGTAWFDDVKVEEIKEVPAGKEVINLYSDVTDSMDWLKKGNNGIMIFFAVMAIFLICALLIFILALNIQRFRNNELYSRFEFLDIDENNKKRRLLNKSDVYIVTCMTIAYLLLSLYRLGSTNVPKTFWAPVRQGESFTLDLGKETDVSRIYYYCGLGEGKYRLEYMDETGEFMPLKTLDKDEFGDLYVWKYADIPVHTSQIRIIADTYNAMLYEIGIFEEGSTQPLKGIKIIDKNVESLDDGIVENVLDEQDTIEYSPSFMTGMYFDEVYHARTAYEYLHKINPYETTHPPLGKIMIALGILVFGMNPFGWRIAGTLVGVIMIPVMYAFGKKIFRETFPAFCTAFLMMFDFMHFTQTRIATIDSYGTLFVILMYYFMYDYYINKSYNLGFRQALKYLFLTGLCFGLGAASKWICIYAGAGIGVLFFLAKFYEYRDYADANKRFREIVEREKKGMEQAWSVSERKIAWIKDYVPLHVNWTLFFCILFFIIIPGIIYVLSYIPFMMVQSHDLRSVWENQVYMYKYHSNDVLQATHDYASKWWSWPIIYKPMWFYEKPGLPQGRASSIVTMGNPAIWWVGIVAFVAAVIISTKKRDRRMVPIFIAAAFQYLPWMFIKRTTFIYHFFSTVPFVIICIVYVINYVMKEIPKARYVVYAYLTVVLVLFVMFYPVLSGMEVSRFYVDNFLRWFGNAWFF